MERRLEIVIDPRKAETGADRVVTATNKIVDAGERVRNKFKAISGSFEDFSKQIKNASTGLSTRSFDAMMNALEANNKAMLQVQKTTEQLKKSTDALGKTTSTAAGRIDRASDSLKKYDGQTKTVIKTNKQATKGFLTFNQAVMGFALTVGSLQVGNLVMDVGRMLDTFTEWENKLAVVTGGTVDLTKATNDLVEVSIRSRTDMTATMDLYSKMIRVNQRYDFSQQQVLQITETVSQAIAMSGASVQGAQGAILQFAQALSGDFKASAQELNSIIEQTPGLAQAVAQAIGTTTDQLKRLAEDGLINTKDVLEGLLRIAPQIREQFERSNITIGQSIGGISDALTNLLGQNEKLNKGSKELAKSIQSLALNLKEYEDEIVSLSIALGAMATSVLPALLAAFVVMIGPIGQIILLFGTMAGAGAALGLKIRDMVDNIDEWNNQTERTVAETNKRKKAFNELATTLDKLTDRQLVKFEADWYTENYDQILKLRGDVESFQKKYPNGITEAMIKGQSVASRQKVNLSFELEKYTAKVDLLNQLTKEQNAITAKSAALQDRLHKEFEEGIKVATGSGEAIDEATIALKAYIDEIKDPATAKAWKTYRQSIEKVIELGGDEEVQAEALKVAWGKLQKSLEDVGKSSTKTTKSVEKQKKSFEELLATYSRSQSLINAYNKDIKEIKESSASLVEQMILEALALAKLNKELYESDPATKAATKASKERAKAYEQEQKRINDLAESYADTFMDGINAAMNGLDSFKDWFKNHLKEMALIALKNQITIGIKSSLTGGGTGNILSSFLGGGSGGISSLFSGGISGIINNLGSGLAESLTSSNFVGPTRLTDVLAGGGGSIIPSILSAATPFMFAVPAMMLLSDLFSGGNPRMTFAQGASQGMDVTMGGFGRTGDDTITTHYDYAKSIQTAFGEFGAMGGSPFTAGVSLDDIGGYLDLVGTLDAAIAGMLDASTISSVSSSLANRQTFLGTYDQYLGEGESVTRQRTSGTLGSSTGDPTYQLIERYTQIINESLPEELAMRVLEKSGEEFEVFVEHMVTTLDTLNTQVQLVNSSVELFGGTFGTTGDAVLSADKIVAAAGGIEAFAAGLNRFNQEVNVNTSGLQFLEQVKDLSKVFTEMGVDTLPLTTDQFTNLMASLDLTSEAGQELYGKLINISPAVFDVTNAFDAMLAGIQPLRDLSQSIRETLMSEEELYNFRKAQAEALSDALSTMTDPTQILESTTQIEQLVSSMFSSLNQQQQQALGGDIISYLDDVADIAENRITELTEASIVEGQSLAVSEQQAADMTQQAAQNMSNSASELSSAASALMSAASAISNASSASVSAIKEASRNIGGTENVYAR